VPLPFPQQCSTFENRLGELSDHFHNSLENLVPVLHDFRAHPTKEKKEVLFSQFHELMQSTFQKKDELVKHFEEQVIKVFLPRLYQRQGYPSMVIDFLVSKYSCDEDGRLVYTSSPINPLELGTKNGLRSLPSLVKKIKGVTILYGHATDLSRVEVIEGQLRISDLPHERSTDKSEAIERNITADFLKEVTEGIDTDGTNPLAGEVVFPELIKTQHISVQNATLFSAPKLKSINDYCYLIDAEEASLPLLEEIGGGAIFSVDKLKVPNLRKVGETLSITKMTNPDDFLKLFPSLVEVGKDIMGYSFEVSNLEMKEKLEKLKAQGRLIFDGRIRVV
jgi:hypothetical protein